MPSLKRNVLFAVILSAGIFIAAQGLAADTVKIVHIDPFSGPFQELGDRHFMATQFAVDEINAQGGLLGKKWSSSTKTVN
jgi:ABC-type branched-subunit amino acid transport system substrate-binding protein